MKFSLAWLKDHLHTDLSLAGIADVMTMAGLEVEAIAVPLAFFTSARIVDVRQHPNADKLQVCDVDTVDGRKEIVCGALNARAGLVTAYAPIGAKVPGTGIVLEPRAVRGVVSNGMLCSERELELPDDPFGLRMQRFPAWSGRARALGLEEAAAHAEGGILELPDDVSAGRPVAELVGLETVIDFEVTPNRPDWLGVAGIARDLAAAGAGSLIAKPQKPTPGQFALPVAVGTDAPGACPAFAARLIRGVQNRESPAWLKARLESVGVKPRNVLVDVTNYLCLDRARPLHVYDAEKLQGRLHARLGHAGESFEALDGRVYAVTPDMCVIADDRGVIGLGGVMGGTSTGSSLETRDVLIECALFDPTRTFKTLRATGIASDAGYRFARGVDSGFLREGLDRATALIIELCGGEPSEIVIDGEIPPAPGAVAFDPVRVRTLAGLDVKPQRVKAILQALGCAVALDADRKTFLVTPPTWRRDLTGPADLVEEVARIEGYDRLPAAEPPRAPGGRAPPASLADSRQRIARRVLAAGGYLEAVTWSFCPRADASLFGAGENQIAALTLANPIAAELDCMRPSALPNLIRAAKRNLDRGRGDVRLFEAGPVYVGDGEDGQRPTIAAVWQPRPQPHWRNPPAPDVFALKADCLAVLETLGAPMNGLFPQGPTEAWQHPGQSGGFKLANKTVAAFGAVHPRVLAALDAAAPVFAFEIWLDALPGAKSRRGQARPALERRDLMPLNRDFAFIVAEKVPAADLVRAAYGADRTLIDDVTVFDVYRGPGVPPGSKSLAIAVRLQPTDKTLTELEIDGVSARIVSAVAKATGGALRS
jgi:phenylalanyl-tRNA synthetase beta chain